MSELSAKKSDYGNWVSAKLVYTMGALGVLLLGLSFVFLPLLIGAAFFLLACAYFVYARYQFSPRGRNLQARIRNLVLDHLDWDGEGRALDIGCGNAPLSIEMAKKYPNAQVTGIDYWGGLWEYSKEACETNAEVEGVADQLTFQKASAAALPFDDESFDVAVSNFVFHEVRDVEDTRDVLKEALRVVKPGGKFAFQDLFLVRSIYGDVDDLLETIKSWGVGCVGFMNTSNSNQVPKALRLPFMVGSIGIIYGTK